MGGSSKIAKHRYIIALGSNQRHGKLGTPRKVLAAALQSLGDAGGELRLIAAAPVIITRPIGPSLRNYANSAALIETALAPTAMMLHLLAVETTFGRKRRGMAWRARVLDLDLILWDGGMWHDAVVTLPHPQFTERAFVLGPASKIGGFWRDPQSSRNLRQLHHRLQKPQPIKPK